MKIFEVYRHVEVCSHRWKTPERPVLLPPVKEDGYGKRRTLRGLALLEKDRNGE